MSFSRWEQDRRIRLALTTGAGVNLAIPVAVAWANAISGPLGGVWLIVAVMHAVIGLSLLAAWGIWESSL